MILQLSADESHLHFVSESYKKNNVGCTSEVFITLKVVPEYLTWTGAVSNNTNWNRDENWTRSDREELYKYDPANMKETYADYKNVTYDQYSTIEDSDENYHYFNDSEIFEGNTKWSKANSYTPMYFSKVVIPADVSQFPYLAALTTSNHSAAYDDMTNRDGSTATTNIQYDMALHVDSINCNHTVSRNGTFYDCVHFKANICDQILFKPGGELRYQHYLDYNTAWSEQELTPGTWSLISAPLKDTYAADMYVAYDRDGSIGQPSEEFKDL